MPTGNAVTTYPAPATNAVSTTSVAGTTITLTVPAAAAGLYNYLVSLEIMLTVATTVTGAATPFAVTSTGITGTPTFYLANGTSAVVGALLDKVTHAPHAPLKGSATATAMTFVAPALAGAICAMRATYYTDV